MFSAVYILLFFLPSLFAFQFDPYIFYKRLQFPYRDFGPDSVALDPYGEGPYVTEIDGRVLKYNDITNTFDDFAYTSPNRTKEICDGTSDNRLGPTCGRPFGLSFDYGNGDLYIVDAYHGLYRVGREGGQATLLANNASDVLFNFPSGVDFDSFSKVVYLTDSSLITSYGNIQSSPDLAGDSSGRLIRYDTKTGEVSVLLEGLHFPTGPAVSRWGKHVFFSSFSAGKILKYSVGVPNVAQELFKLPAGYFPIKVKRAQATPKNWVLPLEFEEYFWVAINKVVAQEQQSITYPFGYKFNSNGDILLKKDLSDHYNNMRIDVMQEYYNLHHGYRLYVGALSTAYVGIYSKLL